MPIVGLEEQTISLKKQIEQLKKDSHNLIDTQNVLEMDVQEQKTILDTTLNERKEVEQFNKELISHKQQLIKDIGVMDDKKTVLKQEIEALNIQKSDISSKILGIDNEYRDKIAEKEQLLKQLDAKLLDVTTSIRQFKEEEATARTQLATWRKTLEEKDQNLRLREQKVEQGENKLINNSNLLNL